MQKLTHNGRAAGLARTIVLATLVASATVGCAASSRDRREFASPEEASSSLVAALRADDRAKLRAMLGPESDRVLYSGDRIADRARMARFLAAYDRRHQLERSPDGSFMLA